VVTTIFDKVFLLSWHVYATGMRNSCEVLISIDTVKALAGMHEQRLVFPYLLSSLCRWYQVLQVSK
jgi:hypothetical protein